MKSGRIKKTGRINKSGRIKNRSAQIFIFFTTAQIRQHIHYFNTSQNLKENIPRYFHASAFRYGQ